MTLISSRSNPKAKAVRALRQHKTRLSSGVFLVEGIRHVGEAIESGAAVQYLCYAPDLLKSDYAQQLIAEQSQHGLPCFAFTAEVFASMAEKDNPQGLLAVVEPRQYRLAELNPENFSWGVALVAPQDPGNFGTILRSVDATGASGVLLLDSSVDPYHPSAVRASMGALFWYPIVQTSFAEFKHWSQANHYHVYGTSAHGSQDFRQVEGYSRPRILLMGSERQGLTPEQAAICEALIRLPMQGRATSLNLGVATGIMLYMMLERDAALTKDNR